MRRPYGILLAGTLLAGLLLVALGRAPRREPPRSEAPPEAPTVPILLEIRDGAVLPSETAAPKDRRVRLTVRNRDMRTVRFGLAGYEDRMLPRAIGPGDSLSAEFLADRPGEDFAWLLDGEPGGRFRVTGSHLMEGHR